MDLDFQGFEFKIRRKYGYTEAPKQQSDEASESVPVKSKLDLSLDEIANTKRKEKQEKAGDKKLVWSSGINMSRQNELEKEKIMNLRLPASLIQELAERVGVDTKQYYVKAQAILKPKSKYC